MDSSLKQKTAKGLFWGGLNNGFQQLIAVFFGIYMARILNANDYGLVGVLAIFIAISSALTNSGFSIALTNKKDATQRDYDAVFWFSVGMGCVLYVILFFCAPLIAAYFGRPELKNLSRLLFLSFLFGSIGTVPYTVMFKQLMTKQQARIESLSLLVAVIIGLILAFRGYAYWALAIQMLIHTFLTALFRFIFAPWKPTFSFDFSPLKQLFSFSSKLLLSNIFTIINTHIFTWILGKFHSINDAGNFSQGQKWSSMSANFINGMIQTVTQPVLAQINDEKQRQVSVLRKLIRFGAFVSFPLLLGLAFVGEEFILLAIGENWRNAIPFLQLLCIWNAFLFLNTLFINLIYTHGKSNIYMNLTLITGLTQLIIVLLLYRNIFVMLIAYIVLSFIGLCLWQYQVKKLIGLRMIDVLKDIVPYLGISLLCFGISELTLILCDIENLCFRLILKITISAGLYIAALKGLKSVIFEESLAFFSSLQRNPHPIKRPPNKD